MENKQDIGKAFKDRLSGLHREPGDAVWQNISASLQQQKRGGFRMPLWGKATSIIAVVALVAVFTYPQWDQYVPQVTITMPNEGPESGNQNPKTGSRNAVTGTGEAEDSQTATQGNTVNNPEAITNAKQTANAAESSQGTAVNGSESTNGYANTTTAHPAAPSANSKPNQGAGHKSGIRANATTAIASQSKTAAHSAKISNAGSTVGNPDGGLTGISATAKTTATGTGNTTPLPSESKVAASGQTNKVSTPAQTGVAAVGSQTTTAAPQSTATQTATTGGATRGYAKNLDGNIVYSTGNFPTITKAMADSLLVAQKKLDEEKSRERTYAQPAYTMQELTGGEGNANDFYVFAFIAPTNYKFGESNSLIDPSLNNRGTSAETSNNYGAYIGYEFSSQFSLRAGISSVSITQRTGNVSLDGNNYTGVDYTSGMSNSSAAATLGNTVGLRQKTSVIEVPLEATYAMFGTRADLYFKGGVSMFFLNENQLFAENGQGSVLLGSLNRANDFSLSGNAGIGFYYKFLRELQLNVEPGFKYYFNTFEGVNPVSLYAQAGLLYRF